MAVNFNAADRVGVIGGYIGGIGQLLNWAGGMCPNPAGVNCVSAVEDRCVTRHELDLIREIQNKDAALSIANSENYTDKKLTEVYAALANRDKDINAKIDANYREQAAINLTQATYNASNNAAIACMQNQINVLVGMTKTVIPAANICPAPMPQYNSWTAPTAATTA